MSYHLKIVIWHTIIYILHYYFASFPQPHFSKISPIKKISPLNKIRSFSFHLDHAHAQHVSQNWWQAASLDIFREKDAFQKKDVFLNDLSFLERRIFSSKWYLKTPFESYRKNNIYSYRFRTTLTKMDVFLNVGHSHKSPPKWTNKTR